MDELFNSEWFIQLLAEKLLKFPYKYPQTRYNDVLRLFCVNQACRDFARRKCKFITIATDNSSMQVLSYEYLYDTHAEAALDLPNVMDDHPNIPKAYYEVCFYIHRVYPIFYDETEPSYLKKKFVNTETALSKKTYYLQTKLSCLYHMPTSLPYMFDTELYLDSSDEENLVIHPTKEYSGDDCLPFIRWKKEGVFIDHDLDPKCVWDDSEDSDIESV